MSWRYCRLARVKVVLSLLLLLLLSKLVPIDGVVEGTTCQRWDRFHALGSLFNLSTSVILLPVSPVFSMTRIVRFSQETDRFEPSRMPIRWQVVVYLN